VIPAFHRDAEGGPNLQKGRMMDDSKEHTEADNPPNVALSNFIIDLLTAASKVHKILREFTI